MPLLHHNLPFASVARLARATGVGGMDQRFHRIEELIATLRKAGND